MASSSLHAGLLAGGIGLALVIDLLLPLLPALGLITVASLVVSGLLVYATVVLLGQWIDFTLSLAGIAGFIVAIGITADSFVVFFERLKDEVREGRTVRTAVDRGVGAGPAHHPLGRHGVVPGRRRALPGCRSVT